MLTDQPVSILYHSNYATLTRGGQRSLWYLLKALDRSRFMPVLTCREEGELTAWARSCGIPVHVLPLPRLRPWHLAGIARYVSAMHRIVRQYRCRIFHSEELVSVVLVALLKPLTGIRTIWHVRVSWDTPAQKRIGSWFADRILAVSRAVAASFPPAARAMTVHNGIDIQEWSPGSEPYHSERFSDSAFVIGYTGALAEQKGIETLIAALHHICRKYPSLVAVMAGSGTPSYTARLRSLITEADIEKSVMLLGEEHTNMPGLVNRFDIFVLPSLTEGLSRSLLEAMSCARPVIASDIPQNTELVIDNKTGLSFSTSSPSDLSEKIDFLITNPRIAAALGAAAREHVAAHYTIERMMGILYTVYDELTSARRSAAS